MKMVIIDIIFQFCTFKFIFLKESALQDWHHLFSKVCNIGERYNLSERGKVILNKNCAVCEALADSHSCHGLLALDLNMVINVFIFTWGIF